jgi:hypothetical protein
MLSGVDYVWTVLIIATLGGIAWFSYMIEPHYASKDGLRFLCNTQEFLNHRSTGRKREARVTVMPDRTLYVTQKQGVRRKMNTWSLIGVSPAPPKRMRIYVAQRMADGEVTPTQLMLRLPTKSRCVPILDQILVDKGIIPAVTAPGTPSPEDPPARG